MVAEVWALGLQVAEACGWGSIFSLESGASCCAEATVDASEGGAPARARAAWPAVQRSWGQRGRPSVPGLSRAGCPFSASAWTRGFPGKQQ